MTDELPTAEEQLRFLQNLQLLLDEGIFVSTYKFSLLLALADLAVEKGDVGGARLRITVREIAEKFIGYYWRQVVQYPAMGGVSDYLHFVADGEAAIVQAVRAARMQANGSLPRARRDKTAWSNLVTGVAKTIRIMPLWRLQTVRTGVHDFLYPNVGKGVSVEMRPGIAYCLRVFHGHVQNLVQGAWARWVRRLGRNAALLGHAKDLGEFLFGSERESHGECLPWLTDLQSGRCFYCLKPLRERGEVDHFIPWVRYPVDLGHNFVLAHRRCNNDKSDVLADPHHLAKWVERNRANASESASYFAEKAVAHDLGATEAIAEWAYGQTELVRGDVWVAVGEPLARLDPGWRTCFLEAPPRRTLPTDPS